MLPEYVPDDAPANLDDPPPLYSEYEVPVYDSWRCFLSPTYNEDWHDDVLCRKGNESVRPYLREWDDFVEEWEMRESAEEYEAELNAGG